MNVDFLSFYININFFTFYSFLFKIFCKRFNIYPLFILHSIHRKYDRLKINKKQKLAKKSYIFTFHTLTKCHSPRTLRKLHLIGQIKSARAETFGPCKFCQFPRELQIARLFACMAHWPAVCSWKIPIEILLCIFRSFCPFSNFLDE